MHCLFASVSWSTKKNPSEPKCIIITTWEHVSFLVGLCLFKLISCFLKAVLCVFVVTVVLQTLGNKLRLHPAPDLPIQTAPREETNHRWIHWDQSLTIPPVKEWRKTSCVTAQRRQVKCWSSLKECSVCLVKQWITTFHLARFQPVYVSGQRLCCVDVNKHRTNLLWLRKTSESVLTCLFWSSLSPVREKGERGTSWKRSEQRNDRQSSRKKPKTRSWETLKCSVNFSLGVISLCGMTASSLCYSLFRQERCFQPRSFIQLLMERESVLWDDCDEASHSSTKHYANVN